MTTHTQEKIRQLLKALLLKKRCPPPATTQHRPIEWRPWGYNGDLSLVVPLADNVQPGQRVQLLSAICPPDQVVAAPKTNATAALTTTTAKAPTTGMLPELRDIRLLQKFVLGKLLLSLPNNATVAWFVHGLFTYWRRLCLLGCIWRIYL